MSLRVLLNGKTDTGAGSWVTIPECVFSVIARISDTTTPTATVLVEWSPDEGTTVDTIGTFVFDAANQKKIGTFEVGKGGKIRLNNSAISGTNAATYGKVRY